jgi:hypothetical protein
MLSTADVQTDTATDRPDGEDAVLSQCTWSVTAGSSSFSPGSWPASPAREPDLTAVAGPVRG